MTTNYDLYTLAELAVLWSHNKFPFETFILKIGEVKQGSKIANSQY